MTFLPRYVDCCSFGLLSMCACVACVWVKRHARLDGNGRHICIISHSYSYSCLSEQQYCHNIWIEYVDVHLFGLRGCDCRFTKLQRCSILQINQLQMSLIWLQRLDNEFSNFLAAFFDLMMMKCAYHCLREIKWAIDWINIDNLLNQREYRELWMTWNDSNVNCNFHELMLVFVLCLLYPMALFYAA